MSTQYTYPDFKTWDWKSFSDLRKKIELIDFININYEKGRAFHVGTDSKVRKNKTIFATALIAHSPKEGGVIAIHKAKEDSQPSLRLRLLMEAMRTIEVAFYLDTVLPMDAKIRLHVDVNNDVKFKSGRYREELVGMIMGQGYVSYREVRAEDQNNHNKIVFWKPDSWAAQSVADKMTR